MKPKKAQGLSINTIIIAAIALIVLVVLIAIFTGRLSIWGEEVDGVTRGTFCTDAAADAAESENSLGGTWRISCGSDERAVYRNFADAESGQTCCVPT